MRRSRSEPNDDPYAYAMQRLKKSISDPEKFEQALALAIHHCEKARAYDWSEAEIRQRARDAKGSWDSANAAALKLAQHLEMLDPLTGYVRLERAWSEVAKLGIKKMPPPPQSAIFVALLRALAKQLPGKGGIRGYNLGPLGVGKPSRKMPSREVALTVALAHIFGRVMAHGGPWPLALNSGEAIKSGRAWDAAAEFASAALGCTVDADAPKKYSHDHKGHLYFRSEWKPVQRKLVRPRPASR